MNKRNEIIQQAVIEKLQEGVQFFTADDILAVAGIDDKKLAQIKAKILQEAANAAVRPDNHNGD